MTYGKRLTMSPMQSLAAASITSSYVAIGTGVVGEARILWVYNLTDATLNFSLDGVTTHFELPSSGFVILDGTANKSNTADCFWPNGLIVYVKRNGTPTAGTVNVSAVHSTQLNNA
jgi:hypothetical protein